MGFKVEVQCLAWQDIKLNFYLALHTMCMKARGYTLRTNIVIDVKLMSDVLRATGVQTKREVIDMSLRTLLRLKKQQKIKTLRGKINWEGDLEQMRRGK